MRRRVRGGLSISFKFLLPPKIAATASRPSPITHALRAITKSAKRNAICLNNSTERIRFVPASPPPILLCLAPHGWRFRVFDLNPMRRRIGILVIRSIRLPAAATSTVAATANSPSAAWELRLAPGEERPRSGGGLTHQRPQSQKRGPLHSAALKVKGGKTTTLTNRREV
jgi:hypothetical protein